MADRAAKAVRRSGLATVAALAALLVLVGGCSSPGPRPSPGPTPTTAASPSQPAGKPGGTLTLAGTSTRAELDPGAATDDASLLLGRLVYRQLYSYGTATSAPQPDLADGAPQLLDGGRIVRIRLRGDVRWNVPAVRRVASGDVLRGLKRLCLPGRSTAVRGYLGQLVEGYAGACQRIGRLAPSAAAVDAVGVPGLLAVGDDQVELHLVRPAADLVGVLAQPAASPVPAELSAQTGRQEPLTLVGDGPYRFGAPESGELYRLTRNPAWDPSSDALRQALADRVVVRGGLAAAAVNEQVRSGAADLSWGEPAGDQFAQATPLLPAGPAPAADGGHVPRSSTGPATGAPESASRGPAVAVTPGRALTLLAVGSRGPASSVLRQQPVRSAVAACVDRDAVAAALGQKSTPLAELLPADAAATDGSEPSTAPSAVPTLPRALASARSPAPLTPPALTAAGPTAAALALCRAAVRAARIAPGTVLTLLATTSLPAGRAASQALASSLVAGGLEVRRIDGPPSAVRAGGWDLALLQVQPAPTGARTELGPLLDPRWPGAAGAPSVGPLADRQPLLTALADALARTDSGQRAQSIDAAVQAVQSGAALVPLAETPALRPVGPHLTLAPVLSVLANVDPANAALDATRPRTDPAKSVPTPTRTP